METALKVLAAQLRRGERDQHVWMMDGAFPNISLIYVPSGRNVDGNDRLVAAVEEVYDGIERSSRISMETKAKDGIHHQVVVAGQFLPTVQPLQNTHMEGQQSMH